MNTLFNPDEFFKKSLDINEDRLIPFMSYLLQDLWSLGGNPQAVINVVKRKNLIKPESKIIDLGCGKAATIIQLAKIFPAQYVGIDLVEDFIEEGKKFAIREGVQDILSLYANDFFKSIKDDEKFNLIIYGYDSEAFGSVSESIYRIKTIKAPGGHIIFETSYKTEAYENDNYLDQGELIEEIENTGFKIIDSEIWPQEYLRNMNRENNLLISKRVEELKIQYPEESKLFESFYQNQLEECHILDNYIRCVAYLLD